MHVCSLRYLLDENEKAFTYKSFFFFLILSLLDPSIALGFLEKTNFNAFLCPSFIPDSQTVKEISMSIYKEPTWYV